MARGSSIEYTPVGSTLQNGYDLGGARVYPFSTGLAINPPSYYSNYIGTGTGLPVNPPVSALSGTTGVQTHAADAAAAPFSLTASPLPWVILGLFGAVAALHIIHYK